MKVSDQFNQISQQRQFLTTWVIAAMLLFVAAADVSRADTLPSAGDLTRDARAAKQSQKPILVFFSSESCPYCEIVRDLYLQPMQEDKAYNNKIIIREVSIEGMSDMRDFLGTRMDHQGFADQEGASFTPIVRLYSPTGELLTPELVGYSSPDFYLGYLEESIESARKKMRTVNARISSSAIN